MIHRTQFTLQQAPSRPGVYVFRNHSGDVIYVGKAKNLRKRMASYFQPSRRRTADVKVRALINSIEYVEIHPVAKETEAYLLESRLVKQYTPRYNVELRDDKRFLLVAVDPNEPFPRLKLTRLKKDDGRLYFGPFPRAGALRQTVHYLAKSFHLRTCSVRTPNADTRRHCIERIVRQCSCPCTGHVTAAEYRHQLDRALDVLRGRSNDVEKKLEEEMKELAERQRYEDAARCRDILDNLRHVCQVEKMRSFERVTLTNVEPQDGMEMLREALGLQELPTVIECFDVSNIGGHLAVASMVCFRAGKPSSKDYRRFRIRARE
ncbi:MAG: GIY-YIG nuclease family protein, partial [Candidatus Pacebacteria bacterium]|nr:GIY-YIG nuclease family protein [Candidatus Paceibacterota bacterium]